MRLHPPFDHNLNPSSEDVIANSSSNSEYLLEYPPYFSGIDITHLLACFQFGQIVSPLVV
jgi:hypothetical protein